MNEKLRRFWRAEEGIGTLEILLIIAVIVIIAIAFRKWIMRWLENLFTKADTEIINQGDTIRSDADNLSPKTTP